MDFLSRSGKEHIWQKNILRKNNGQDAGRFGFVRLQWFSEGEGFDSAMVFSDGGELFEELWRIWYEHEVLTPVLGTPLAELDYDEIFQTLSKDRQEEISEKKKYFLALCKDALC